MENVPEAAFLWWPIRQRKLAQVHRINGANLICNITSAMVWHEHATLVLIFIIIFLWFFYRVVSLFESYMDTIWS